MPRRSRRQEVSIVRKFGLPIGMGGTSLHTTRRDAQREASKRRKAGLEAGKIFRLDKPETTTLSITRGGRLKIRKG